MSTLIAGSEDTAVSITRYSRGRDLGYGYQVTWRHTSGEYGICHLSFDDEDKARAFYHLIYLSIDVA